jgi:hypothetical protein
LVAEIEAALAEAELTTTLAPTIAGLMGTFGMTIAEAIALVHRAIR